MLVDMMLPLLLLLLLPLATPQDAPAGPIDDYADYVVEDSSDTLDALEPTVESCEQNGRCQCRISGEWTRHKEYEALKATRVHMESLEMRLERLDYGQLYQSMVNITARLQHLEARISTQSIDLTTKELIDLKKGVDVMHVLVAQMQRNASSVELTAIKGELDKLVGHVDDLWGRNPYGSKDQIQKELEQLRSRLQGCKDQFGGLGKSYFSGDSQPITNDLDKAWCESHVIDSVSDAFTHRYVRPGIGSWFKDPLPRSSTTRTQVFQRDASYNGVFSYKNYTDFITNRGLLRQPATHCHGVGTAAYNGSIYWPYNGQLYRRNSLDEVSHVPTAGYLSLDYMGGGNEYTYVDLKPDEYGLWALWATLDNKKKVVLHEIDPETLEVRRSIPTNRLKTSTCMAFMACGRFYALDICEVRLPPAAGYHEQYEFDTRTQEGRYRQLHITSKYGRIYQLAYNAREKMLLGWDNGHAVSYQIRWRNTITGEIEAPPGTAPPEPM